jgi:CFEM domain
MTWRKGKLESLTVSTMKIRAPSTHSLWLAGTLYISPPIFHMETRFGTRNNCSSWQEKKGKVGWYPRERYEFCISHGNWESRQVKDRAESSDVPHAWTSRLIKPKPPNLSSNTTRRQTLPHDLNFQSILHSRLSQNAPFGLLIYSFVPTMIFLPSTIAVLSFALLINGQSIPALPACASNCVVQVCGGTSSSDLQCFCNINQEFNIEGCWSTSCSPNDIGSAYVVLNSACGISSFIYS